MGSAMLSMVPSGWWTWAMAALVRAWRMADGAEAILAAMDCV